VRSSEHYGIHSIVKDESHLGEQLWPNVYDWFDRVTSLELLWPSVVRSMCTMIDNGYIQTLANNKVDRITSW